MGAVPRQEGPPKLSITALAGLVGLTGAELASKLALAGAGLAVDFASAELTVLEA